MKRIFDTLISFLLCVIIAPVFILLFILIKLTSKGPAIFRQERIGKDAKTFRIYKFRTLSVEALKYEANPLDDDPRIKGFAKFVRLTGLDELPQLFNVLKGDMSLVGPRPCMPFEREELERAFGDLWQERSKLLPGITGLWQVSRKNIASVEDKVFYDSIYIRRHSLWLDGVILLKTAIIPLKIIFKYLNSKH